MKTRIQIFFSGLLAVVFLMLADVSAATIQWDTGGDGLSIYQEANWVVTDDTGSPSLIGLIGSDPPAGFVNPSVDVEADVIVGGFSVPGGGSGGSPHFHLGDSLSLTVQDNSTWRMANGAGILGVSGGVAEALTIKDSAEVITQFLVDLQVTMTDSAKLVFNGGNNPVNFTTIALSRDWTGTITFNSETPTDVLNEHLFKMSLDNGDSLAVGINTLLVSNGGTGAILSLIIPEPTSIALCILALVGVSLRFRR